MNMAEAAGIPACFKGAVDDPRNASGRRRRIEPPSALRTAATLYGATGRKAVHEWIQCLGPIDYTHLTPCHPSMWVRWPLGCGFRRRHRALGRRVKIGIPCQKRNFPQGTLVYAIDIERGFPRSGVPDPDFRSHEILAGCSAQHLPL